MELEVLLAHLRALIERAPDFERYSPTEKSHMIWLSQAHALISRWDKLEASAFKSASDSLPLELMRDHNVARILGTIHRVIADLELRVPNNTSTVFGAGEVYDMFRALNEVTSSAERSIFVVDPYLDDSVFHHYLSSRRSGVKVRLLLSKNTDQLKVAAEKYNLQHGDVVELRRTKAVHDRVIFLDDYVCWVLGQSLKDAAKAKPTYLAPLAPDVVSDKLQVYNEIWDGASKI